MEMDLTNSVNPMRQYQRAPQKAISRNTTNRMNMGSVTQTANSGHMQSTGFTLHIGSGENTDRMLSAVAGRGKGGMTVFKPADFDAEKPMYKVCTRDQDGNMTERMVDLTKLTAFCMQMQYDGGNLKGYLEYKKFVDFFG